MSTQAAPEGRTITFLVPDESGHSTHELDPAAAAGMFSGLRARGFALFDASNDTEQTLLVDAGQHGETLPERVLAMPPYEGG